MQKGAFGREVNPREGLGRYQRRRTSVRTMTLSSPRRTHFESVHARRDDPWHVFERWYEIRKRRLFLASLPNDGLGRVLEIGCSIGAMTVDLAARADAVVALDLSDSAVASARERTRDLAHVRVDRADVRDGLPDGPFDTVVLSEVGYYFELGEWTTLLAGIGEILSEEATVGLCHWQEDEPDFALSPEAVHEIAISTLGLAVVVRHREDDFRLDVLSRSARSVAQRDGGRRRQDGPQK